MGKQVDCYFVFEKGGAFFERFLEFCASQRGYTNFCSGRLQPHLSPTDSNRKSVGVQDFLIFPETEKALVCKMPDCHWKKQTDAKTYYPLLLGAAEPARFLLNRIARNC